MRSARSRGANVDDCGGQSDAAARICRALLGADTGRAIFLPGPIALYDHRVRELKNTFVLDDSQAPLLLMRQYGDLDDAQWREYLTELGKRFITIPRVLLVFDMTYANPITPKQRRMQAEWLQDNERDVVRCTVGAAFCVPGLLIRGAIRAVMWVSPPRYPYYVGDNLDAVMRWAALQLRAEGHRLPAPLAPYAG